MWREWWQALILAPKRSWDSVRDPVRRWHMGTQIGMVWLAVWLATGRWRAASLAVTLYYVGYEFLLEPISKWRVAHGKPSLVGPYWERGPQDGETFRFPMWLLGLLLLGGCCWPPPFCINPLR